MDNVTVIDRLDFAKRRLADLEELARNGEDLSGADTKERQQLIQEFFFNLVGAIEFLAQAVNTSKTLEINTEEVTIPKVCNKLKADDPIKSILKMLHPKTRGIPLPNDPYSEEGCHFRIFVYRNRVCHHGHNPFHFRVYIGGPNEEPSTSLVLDPRKRSLGASKESAISELNHFYKLVYDKCQNVLAML
jgi:hypothetical protein